MRAGVVHDGSAGKTWARVSLKDGRGLLVTKGLQGVEVSQASPLPAPQEWLWRRDYAAGHALEAAYRRIVMLLTAGRSIAQITAHENLPETLRGNRVAGIAADLCHAILGTAFAAVHALQKDPLHAGSLGSDLKTFTKDGVEAAFECMAFLRHATGRFALAALGPGGREELMEALADALIAGFTRALYGRRIDAVEFEAVAERLAGKLADREDEYESCARADRACGSPAGMVLWEVGTRTAALLGRTNEIGFIDGIDDQMTACLDGLHLAGRLQPLREPGGALRETRSEGRLAGSIARKGTPRHAVEEIP